MKAKIITKKGNIKKETNNILEWMPELELLLLHFNIEHIQIRLKDSTDKYMIFDEE